MVSIRLNYADRVVHVTQDHPNFADKSFTPDVCQVTTSMANAISIVPADLSVRLHERRQRCHRDSKIQCTLAKQVLTRFILGNESRYIHIRKQIICEGSIRKVDCNLIEQNVISIYLGQKTEWKQTG